ncbi:hypothetical protein BVRB_000120 [Beta vulgaris subsp. vulgaris]|uniref:Uncharacterized protein n=1 Tax=Beta vulgaris subsp. vulgaris TaxID=3555 RepID=A0A0J8B8J7_BETVV|nr:hypothetical protein BVRB_000120 [Beta vulgaris subsp. vulgaris]
MMSIFSSFEAKCAETYGLKFVNFSPPKTTSSSSATSDKSVVDDHRNLNSLPVDSVKKDSENSQNKEVKMKLKKNNPRFALELDGVHCFETIVRY